MRCKGEVSLPAMLCAARAGTRDGAAFWESFVNRVPTRPRLVDTEELGGTKAGPDRVSSSSKPGDASLVAGHAQIPTWLRPEAGVEPWIPAVWLIGFLAGVARNRRGLAGQGNHQMKGR